MRLTKSRRVAWTTAVPLLLSATAAVAGAQGSLSGTVTAAGSGIPLAESRVIVVGTSLFASTGPDGKYTIAPRSRRHGRNARASRRLSGTEEVRSHSRRPRPRRSTSRWPTPSCSSQEVVTTATGEQRRVGSRQRGRQHLGLEAHRDRTRANDRGRAELARRRASCVQQGTQTGSGQRIRVRGISSVSLSNEPIFIIDGIRMSANNGSTSFGNGGNDFSRLGDISPEDIENIEIVKGPSAATLYGTDAANGVIVITTKKGRARRAEMERVRRRRHPRRPQLVRRQLHARRA